MKKELFTTCLVAGCLLLNALHAQQIPSFEAMKKNGITLDPVSIISKKRELRLSYDRVLSRKISMQFEMGLGLKNEDPDLPTFSNEEVKSVFTREADRFLVWFVLIPIWNTTYSKEAPPEWKEIQTSQYIHSNVFGSLEFKFFLISNPRTKLPNGLYLAPGLTIGKKRYSIYRYTHGQRNQIEGYDKETDSWGIPIIFGSYSSTWTERVTVIGFESRTRKTESSVYGYPYVRGGYQIPIGRCLTLDLSGQLLFKTGIDPLAEKPSFPTFFSNPLKNRTAAAVSARIGYRF